MRNMILLGLVLWGWPVQASEIQHAFTTQATEQSSSSGTYVDVTGAAITSGNFTAGKQYLLVVSAAVAEDGNGLANVRVVHGSTAFSQSELIFLRSSTVKEYYAYSWGTVWTAVGGEGIKLQFSTNAGTVYADNISLIAINLSDDLIEGTDWVFDDRPNDDTLSTTPKTGASVSMTPGTGGNDWLVMSWAQIDASGTATTTASSSLIRSGEASSTTPTVSFQPLSLSSVWQVPLVKVYTLAAASNTFSERSVAGGSAHVRLNSAIFALRLNKFATHTFSQNDASVTLGTTSYGNLLGTASITPSVTGDVWGGSYFTFDKGGGIRQVDWRLQTDNASTPAGQTGRFDAADISVGSNDWPNTLHVMQSLNTSAHTFDLDADTNVAASGSAALHRLVFAVTMELASAGGVTSANRRASRWVVE